MEVKNSPKLMPSSCGKPDKCLQYFLSRNVINIVERCMKAMQAGTQMVKLRGSSRGLVRFYYLDEHKFCIRWRPSRKSEKAKISIDSIHEVCEGKQSEIFQRFADGSFDPNCCFSIYYGDQMASLDLVSSNGEEARTWVTGLKYLMAGISDEDSLSKRQRTRDQWLKQTFSEADKNGDGCLSINEVLQLMHKLNVNLPRQKVKQMFKEADTDDNQGTLDFEEFCAFYKMMSTRRDLYLLMLTYSNHKDHLDAEDLKRFLEIEQKMTAVTKEYCLEIVDKFEPCPENKNEGVLGIDGFTNYMRSPAGDIFNPEHSQVNQDMTVSLCHYYIASSHNTYLIGDQLMSQSRADMYAWVLQAGCRCVEVDCWDGPDGEPIVHHGYTLTSKILFKDVIETVNKYAFIKNEYPVILSIENHCSVSQQKKMAQYLIEVLGDKLDLSSVNIEDASQLPSPESLKGKILVKGKKLPSTISEDAEEGEVSDEDSADEIEDDCKLMNGDASANRKQVENIAKKKLDSLLKESKIRDREDPNNFTVTTLPSPGKLVQKSEFKKKSSPVAGPMTEKQLMKTEDEVEPAEETSTNKRHSRSLMGSFSKRKKKSGKQKKSSSLEDDEDDQDLGKGSVHYNRASKQKKTMKLSRALSDLVKYTKSVGTHDVDSENVSSWQVSSFSETKAHQIIQQKPVQFIRFNQHQLSRIYPSSYRVDSSNFNPQPFWNMGCQLVALNYQSEGRVLQLNRAKFSANGNCGYVLKPKCLCQGAFNPNSDDPQPNQIKKQLVLRVISGQQLPKPRDSMLGDRGEIIDPFVEVEIIGLPVDCCKEQTRVVDDNGFNPMWEETLVFILHMPELALIRFLVWDHDPIGRDFIGQRTLAVNSMMPGYRHVYLEGMEEASIFVHVMIHDVTGKVKQAMGLKSLFLRNPKQGSLDSHAAVQLHRKHSFSSHLLRRTASAPTKGQQKSKKGFPEITIDTKEYSSEGASEDRESEDSSQPRFDRDPESSTPVHASRDGTNGEVHIKGFKDVHRYSLHRSISSLHTLETITEETLIIKENSPSDFEQQESTAIKKGYEDGSILPSTEAPPTKDNMEITSPTSQQPETLLAEEQNLTTDQGYADLEAVSTSEHVKDDDIIVELPVSELEHQSNKLDLHSEQNLTSAVCCNGISNVASCPDSSIKAHINCLRDCNNAESSVANGSMIQDVIRRKPSASVTPVKHNSQNATSGTSALQRTQALIAFFDHQPAVPQAGTRMLVRRSKSEGHVMADCQTSLASQRCLSPTAEVYCDITINDKIWSKLDGTSHRDSMSSSSSMSSNDTVIDLSLPNLARNSLSDCDECQDDSESGLMVQKGVRPRSATSSNEIHRVSKSKSNPNLRTNPQTEDEISPRPLTKGPGDALPAFTRRHTWNKLYVESLKQSVPALKSSHQEPNTENTQTKSKSLGDLTSEDIMCNFESKYRSISRSFVTRSMHDHRFLGGMKNATKSQDDLTEKLKQLTSFEEADDITSPTRYQPDSEEENAWPLRRCSSRSQSRVRYIANRAKQAQERQRLQNMALLNFSPIEERGNPEGECSAVKSVCLDSIPLPEISAHAKSLPNYKNGEDALLMLNPYN